ncbi:uncharacterized protein TRIADDRAFT_53248 [Trichoplax adhaerens]|uniref:EGF-like domain-containing protein n=1 Tax=Trichoplax adhaerens TaxID=10228 RepID=B3RNQ3_TRIAD|nr:hypothetical protein TRIADDRAFT_53248 [Trichoplax adhaerens]EDV27502.1 hypothetical protein TRIADDRAFT_53248 [Trichoplax adhaerens]|eukprot:XP_002109336.1 hypothetical protein TRIADDRAFT_53248 [Trichoplax adhaerens]
MSSFDLLHHLIDKERAEEGIATQKICFNYGSNCYKMSFNIQVKNCITYFVYQQAPLTYKCRFLQCVRGNCTSNGSDSVHCICESGYTGILCDSDINTCLSNPCRAGNCINHDGNFTCQYPKGLSGACCNTCNFWKDI